MLMNIVPALAWVAPIMGSFWFQSFFRTDGGNLVWHRALAMVHTVELTRPEMWIIIAIMIHIKR